MVLASNFGLRYRFSFMFSICTGADDSVVTCDWLVGLVNVLALCHPLRPHLSVMVLWWYDGMVIWWQVNKGWNDTEASSRWGQARGGSKPKLTPRSSYYQYRYSHMIMNILVAPLVCAYCNSPLIAFKLLAKHEGSPKTRTTSLPAL